MNVQAFIITLAVGLLAIVGIFAVPFPPLSDSSRSALLCQPIEGVFRAKVEHVLSAAPFDVLLVGNSRIASVSAEHYDAPSLRVFNLAVGGSNFHQNAAVLKILSDAGKGPQLAILSFDNVALSYAPLTYEWPLVPARWRLVAEDVLAALISPNATLAGINAEMNGVLRDEGAVLGHLVNARFAFQRLTTLYNAWTGHHVDACLPFRPDGSATRSVSTADPPAKGPAADIDPLRYSLLENDLRRLAEVQTNGTKVIIYESPLYPGSEALYERRLPEENRKVRQRLFDACRSYGLECRQAPVLNSAEGDYWPDETHAPPKVLGRWLNSMTADRIANLSSSE